MANRGLIIAILNTIYLCQCKNIIFIAKNGHDTPSCKTMNAQSKPCGTLDYVFAGGGGILNDTDIFINSGEYLLKNDTHFKNLENISIVALNAAKITCERPDIGLSFLRSANVVLSGLHFAGCGGKRSKNMYSVLHIVFSKNVNITRGIFENNRGKSISLLDVGGRVQITDVGFSNNTYDHGGGVYVDFTKCGALDPIGCKFQREQQRYIHNAIYTFKDCNFVNNHDNSTAQVSRSDKLFKASRAPLGRGGGLAIFLRGNSSSNHFRITGSTFVNNSAHWGGGLLVEMQAASNENFLDVTNTNFSYNTARYAGGGVQISLFFARTNPLHTDGQLRFTNCFFFKNQAILGGGLAMRGSTRFLQYPNEKTPDSLVLTSCHFTSNYATVGSAFGLSTDNLNHNPVGPGVSCRISFNQCVIKRNTIIWTEDNKVIGQGALYGEELVLSLNETSFIQNDGTSLVLESSSITVHRKVVFQNNTGLRGGALAMFGKSWIHLKEKSELIFENNRALDKGGAMYVKSSGPARLAFKTTKLSTSRCFLRYEDQEDLDPTTWNCSIQFIGNTAPDASGNSIFANTLQMCRLDGEPRIGNKTLRWNIIKFINGRNQSPDIATGAAKIHAYFDDWHVSPSVPFNPRLKIFDETDNSVYGTVRVNIQPQIENATFLSNDVFLVKDRISDVRVTGTANAKFNISFMTAGGQSVTTGTQSQSLKSCPPGFSQLVDHGGDCKCLDVSQIGITRCDDYKVFILRGYWAGMDVNGSMVTFPCPRHYCLCNTEKDHIYECKYHKNDQCAENRQGTLCSQCKKGYSVQIGNEKCAKCSNTNLLLLIPMILVASAFVIVVMYFNFDAFSGYLNAYFYAYQSVNLLLIQNIQLDDFIGLVIGITCLSGTGNTFGLCFFDGFTSVQKLGFNLFVPLYILLFLVALCLFLPQVLWNKIFGNSTRMNSFGRAFSFVYVFCYTSLTSKTIDLLHPIWINNELKLFKAADTNFFGAEHLPYAIPALFVSVVFVIGFPVILLFTPFFTERFPSILRMEPAFNALKNCFKSPFSGKITPNYRPFSAFYFICRFMLLIFGIIIAEETSQLVVFAILCVLFQVIFTWCQPYILWTMNFWDTLILTNLCVISVINIILSVPYVLMSNDRISLVYCVRTLVYVPLASLVLRFIYSLIQKRKRQLKRRRDLEQPVESVDGPAKKRLRMPFLRRKQRFTRSRIPRRLEEDETSLASDVI